MSVGPGDDLQGGSGGRGAARSPLLERQRGVFKVGSVQEVEFLDVFLGKVFGVEASITRTRESYSRRHTHAHTHLEKHTHTYTHTHTETQSNTHLERHTHTHLEKHTHTYTHTH